MNTISKKIVKLLQEDARYSAKTIADMLGVSKKEVEETIEKLENDGVILKYTAVVDDEKIYKEVVDALVEVKVTPQARKGFEKIAQEISNLPQVKNVYLMSGAYDFCVTLEGSTMREVAMFVSERLSTLESVVSVATHFILKKYKEGGVELVSFDEQDKRLKIHE